MPPVNIIKKTYVLIFNIDSKFTKNGKNLQKHIESINMGISLQSQNLYPTPVNLQHSAAGDHTQLISSKKAVEVFPTCVYVVSCRSHRTQQ